MPNEKIFSNDFRREFRSSFFAGLLDWFGTFSQLFWGSFCICPSIFSFIFIRGFSSVMFLLKVKFWKKEKKHLTFVSSPICLCSCFKAGIKLIPSLTKHFSYCFCFPGREASLVMHQAYTGLSIKKYKLYICTSPKYLFRTSSLVHGVHQHFGWIQNLLPNPIS